jgi:DNA-binding CsgD family transcriptional regulator
MNQRDQKDRSGYGQIEELQKQLGIDKERLKFLEDIVNAVPAMLYLMDLRQMKILWCNDRVRNFFGYDMTGMNMMDEKGELIKIYENDQTRALDNLKSWRENEREPGKVVIRMLDSENVEEYFYTDHHIFKRDEEGEPLWLLGVCISMNRQHHTEHEKRLLFSEDIAATLSYLEEISDKELRVLELLSGGLSYQDMADELNLSLDGVRYHIRNIYQQLDVNTRGEAITKALKYRLIQP